MTSRELIRWSSRHERRARRWYASPWLVAIVAGVALHVPVEARLHDAGLPAASHAWLAGALVAFAVAFMRVPFHLYWRADAPLLAQLPIPGGALVDAALYRCARAAAATVLAVVLAALPLLRVSSEVYADHAVAAGVLGLCAAGLLPAVALWAASLVAAERSGELAKMTGGVQVSASALLGALPGFTSSLAIVVVVLSARGLAGDAAMTDVAPELGGLAAASVLALVAARARLSHVMGRILRDVSALDRQRLATLEIRPPTRLENAVAAALGDAGLPYRKDARLMRRRYPMAFALGALAFIVLAIVGLSRPHDPTPWLVATLAGAAAYALALASRLHRAPIELPRLAATLPITPAARTRAKLAWIAVWILTFIAAPAVFAIVRGGA